MTGQPLPAPAAVLETCLYAADLDDCARFYGDVLGLDAFSREAGRHVFFRCGSAMFLLFDPERTGGGGGVPSHGGMAGGHVAFAVPAERIGQWRERLANAGIEIEQEIEWPGGGVSLYVRDPAGNSVELASPTIWRIPEDELFGPPAARGRRGSISGA